MSTLSLNEPMNEPAEACASVLQYATEVVGSSVMPEWLVTAGFRVANSSA